MTGDNQIDARDFVSDALKGAFLSAQFDNYTDLIESLDQPPLWETWGVGLAVVSACSFSAPFGMLLLPCLSGELYERVMTFLIALGIGALSGSCFFVMIPQAFQLTAYEEIDYVSKSWLILTALYTFLAVDRALQYILELRKTPSHKERSSLKYIIAGASSINRDLSQARDQREIVIE